MAFEQPHQFEYMADEGDMSDFVEDADADEENHGRDMVLDEYDMVCFPHLLAPMVYDLLLLTGLEIPLS